MTQKQPTTPEDTMGDRENGNETQDNVDEEVMDMLTTHPSPTPSQELLGIGKNGHEGRAATAIPQPESGKIGKPMEPRQEAHQTKYLIVVDASRPLHPQYSCKELMNGLDHVCEKKKVAFGDVADYYGYLSSEEMRKVVLHDTLGIARSLAWREDCSVEWNTKDEGIRYQLPREITVAAWARAYKFAMEKCPLTQEMYKAHQHEIDHLWFDPLNEECDNEAVIAGIWTAKDAKPSTFGGQDLLILPDIPILRNTDDICFPFTDTVKYKVNIKEIMGQIMSKNYRTAIIMSEEKNDSNQVWEDMKRLQSIGKVNETLIIIIPALVLQSAVEWASQYDKLASTYTRLKQHLEKKQEVCHITLHGPALKTPPYLGYSWTYHGEELAKRYGNKPFEFVELLGYFERLHHELQIKGLNAVVMEKHPKARGTKKADRENRGNNKREDEGSRLNRNQPPSQGPYRPRYPAVNRHSPVGRRNKGPGMSHKSRFP